MSQSATQIKATNISNDRLHIKIYDAAEQVYQVQESVLPRPKNNAVSSSGAALEFSLIESSFSFKVKRKGSDQVLFDTSGATLIFESQYVRLRTQLPQNPSLYGLGEHSDFFRLETHKYTRTFWNESLPSSRTMQIYMAATPYTLNIVAELAHMAYSY
jgi:alpha-glucosidase